MNKLSLLSILIGIGILVGLAYLPTITQPLIEDDFPNIAQARIYGPISGWRAMAVDDVNRVRATTWVLMYQAEQMFGLSPAAFYTISILLHMFNCWLIYAAGRWNLIGYRISAWSTAFFAVYEGHQEAIMWYSACNELLQFLFGMLAFLGFLIFLENGKRKWIWYGFSILAFVFALFSKESAVIFVPILAIPLFEKSTWFPTPKSTGHTEKETKNAFKISSPGYLVPFACLAAVDAVGIFLSHSHSFRFGDGSFELSAPFWITWPNTFFSLLWFWGLLALPVLIVWRRSLRLMIFSLVWTGISIIPYMFVTYQHRIPSRQTYLASAGVAFIVGAAIIAVWEKFELNRKWVPAALIVIIVAHNVVYLWTKKRAQFLDRARPTEELITFAKTHDGPIYITCFPRPPIIGDKAVEVTLGKPEGTLIWGDQASEIPEGVPSFCYTLK